MSKRFTDTDKWKKPFIKSLPTEYKIFWLFLLDECDHAGIWHVEPEVAELRLGIKLSLQKAQGLFNEKVVAFDNGTKWFIPDFIEFQYGVLNPKINAHSSVLNILKRYKIQGFMNPSQRVKDKDMDMDINTDTNEDSSIVRETAKKFLRLFRNVTTGFEDEFLIQQAKCLINSYPEATPERSAALVNTWAANIKPHEYDEWKKRHKITIDESKFLSLTDPKNNQW